MRRVARVVATVAVSVVLCGCVGPADCPRRAAADIVFPHKWLGNVDKIKLREPSGIVYHPGRGTLFVVGDEGDICEIKTDGTLVKKVHGQKKRDYEGITCNPATGLLYIAVEGEERILEVDPDTLETNREIVIERTFQGKTLMKAGGQGIEAITFVPTPNHPEGGTFYVANQSFTLTDPEDISAIFEIEVDLTSGGTGETRGKTLRWFSLGVTDMSGLVYDQASDRLYVISDATNTFWEVTRDGRVIRSLAFPGDEQEGIAMDPEGNIYIAQDTGGILKIKWLRE